MPGNCPKLRYLWAVASCLYAQQVTNEEFIAKRKLRNRVQRE